MAIIGLRDTSGFATTGERPQNWREALLLLYPNSAEAAKAPLTALTSLMKEASTDDPHYHWFTKTLDDRRLKLGATLAASTAGTVAPIVVDATFKPAIVAYENTVILIEQTQEMVLVNQDPTSATGLSVIRGFAGSSPLVAVDPAVAGTNPYILIIGSAFEEGSMPPTGVNFDPEEIYNYTQIFRRTLEITRTASKTRLRTGDAVKEARRECLEYMSIDMERAFILGRRSLQTYNGKPQRTTGGIIWQLQQAAPQNIVDFGGTFDMDELELNMEQLFRWGSYEKVAFCGNGALLAIQQVMRKNTNYQVFVNEKEYGMRVVRILSPFGELVLKAHPLFTQNTGGTTAGTVFLGMSNWMLVMDMSHVRYRYLSGSDLDYEANLQPNGLDGMQSGYLAECGIELEHAITCNLWKGLSRGTKDAD